MDQQYAKEAQKQDLQLNYDRQRNFKMQKYIQEKVNDVHHAAAYDARVKELDHISYRVS